MQQKIVFFNKTIKPNLWTFEFSDATYGSARGLVIFFLFPTFYSVKPLKTKIHIGTM